MTLDPHMAALAARTAAAWRAEQPATIDHAAIPAEEMAIAMANAALDPDGQVYPWRDLYPLAGQTVYLDGALWTVTAKERGPGSETPTAMLQLVGRSGSVTATRWECRPVTWTQGDEAKLSAGPRFLDPITEHTAHRLIPELRGHRPELVDVAGAAWRDTLALEVCREYQRDPTASEDDLRARASATIDGGGR